MTQEELLSVAEVIERLVKRFEEQGAEHGRKMAEHRDSFVARTEADAKSIEGLRQQIETLNREARAAHDAPLVDRVVKERDALRAEVADLRRTFDMVHVQLGIFRRHLRLLGEVLAEYPVGHSEDELRKPAAPTPKQHPVSIGGYVRRTKYSDQCPIGTIGKVAKVWSTSYDVYLVGVVGENCGYWDFANCEPCDPPADHDTPAGKESAEAVIRDSQMTVIEVGDVVEVVSASSCATFSTDIGRRGKVWQINDKTLDIAQVPDYALPDNGVVGKCDVRKVPQ